MAQLTKFMLLLRTAMASVLAVSMAGPHRADADTGSANAYQQAVQAGTIGALENFIARYPLSPEANDAFRDIVTLSRRSRLVGQGPSGLFTTTVIPPGATTRSIDPY